MRQLVELHDHLAAFEGLDADIVAIAQKEEDPAELARIQSLVGPGIQIVCDPEGASSMFSLFGTFLIDTEGNIRRAIPGIKQARARTDLILAELADMTGQAAPAMSYEAGRLEVEGSGAFAADQVMSARWAFSHDRFAPGELTKLLFLPEIAPGWKVYAPGSTLMEPLSIEISLPDGVTLAEPIVFPRPKIERDEFLEEDLAYYVHDIPVTALVFAMDESFAADEVTISIDVIYQACVEQTCLPPDTQHFEMTLPVGTADDDRGRLYNWESW
jgi:hypothetical protein